MISLGEMASYPILVNSRVFSIRDFRIVLGILTSQWRAL